MDLLARAALILAGLTHAHAAGVPADHRRLRPNPAFETLAAMAAGTRDEKNDAGVLTLAYDGTSSGGPVRASFLSGPSFPLPQPPIPTPLLLTPSLGGGAPAPRLQDPPREIPTTPRAPEAAKPALPDRNPWRDGSNGGGGDGITPCQDLRAKAARLDNAAAQCQDDIARGAPYCHVTVRFDSPNIPRTLSPSDASAHARRFREVAARGDEYACRNFGGEGIIPNASPDQMMALSRIADIYDTRANVEVKWALIQWVLGRNIDRIDYGPDSYWTKGIARHVHLEAVRAKIMGKYRANPHLNPQNITEPYNLPKDYTSALPLLFRDVIQLTFGYNMSYTTGSIRLRWSQSGEVDPVNRKVNIYFEATDVLHLQSLSRDPGSNRYLLPDNMFGPNGLMHDIQLNWRWMETISY